jgi:lipoate-protein ligase A
MARDAALARGSLPAVRVFCWDPPAVSLGFRQARPEWLEGPAWRASGLEAVERPTGGGIAFHGSDVSIAVALSRRPGQLLEALLAAVGESAVALCESFGLAARWDATRQAEPIVYCLAQRSPYAVQVGERKVAGFSLRRFPEAWLIEGSLLVAPLPRRLQHAVPAAVLAQLGARATSLADAAGARISEADVATRWARQWETWWSTERMKDAKHEQLEAGRHP